MRTAAVPSSLLHDLVTRLSAFVEDVRPTAFFLEGGHFDPRFGATQFARNSLEDALEVGGELVSRFGRAVRIVFGILVDDLGLDCNGGSCATGSSSAVETAGNPLPDALETILGSHRIVKRDRVVVSSERNAKNRGVERLKRMTSSDNTPGDWSEGLRQERTEKGKRFIIDVGQSVELAAVCAGAWSAKCPLIMAQHYLDVASGIRQRFPAGPRIVLVDWSEMLDRPNVVAGAKVAVHLSGASESHSLDIINVIYGDNAGEIFQIFHSVSAPVNAAAG